MTRKFEEQLTALLGTFVQVLEAEGKARTAQQAERAIEKALDKELEAREREIRRRELSLRERELSEREADMDLREARRKTNRQGLTAEQMKVLT